MIIYLNKIKSMINFIKKNTEKSVKVKIEMLYHIVYNYKLLIICY